MDDKQKKALLQEAMHNLDTASPKDIERAIKALEKIIREKGLHSKSGKLKA